MNARNRTAERFGARFRLLKAPWDRARASKSMHRQRALLGLAALGFVLPYSQFVPWLIEHGLDPGRMIADLWANGMSRFFAMDVLVSAAVLLFFMDSERRVRPTRGAWIAALGTLLVGVSFGLPLYLWLRGRPAQARARTG